MACAGVDPGIPPATVWFGVDPYAFEGSGWRGACRAIDDLVRGGAASGRDDGSGEGPFAPLYRKVGSDRGRRWN